MSFTFPWSYVTYSSLEPALHSKPSSIEFFNEFAKYNGFNPRIPFNWYSITSDDVARAKVLLVSRSYKTYYLQGLHILKPFGNSLSGALLAAYPDIGLRKELFRTIPSTYLLHDPTSTDNKVGHHWEEEANRKAFFDSVAEKRCFDPLLAHHWYQLRTKAILSFKVLNILSVACGWRYPLH
jgi:hypothetical protein